MDNLQIEDIKTGNDWVDTSVSNFDLAQSDNSFDQKPAILEEASASKDYKNGDVVSLYCKNNLRQPDHVPQETISYYSPVPNGSAGAAVSISNDSNAQNNFWCQGEENHNSTNLIDFSEGKDILQGSSESSSSFKCKKELNYETYKPKLKLEWTPPSKVLKIDNTFDAISASVPPRAYAYKDIYQNKREMAVRQREEEERKARLFQSRPAPDFKALHRRLGDVIVIHRITVPLTPETVKHSFADKERRKQKEEQKLDIGRKCLQEMNPFQLRSDQRVRDRQKYNALMQINMEQKQLKLDEQRKKQELDEKKEIRKLTEFRARPNPFK